MEETDGHWWVSAGLVTSSIIAITANSFLLLIFCRRRGLRTVPNRFVINLLIANLMSSLLLVPLLVLDQNTQIPSGENGTTMEPPSSTNFIIQEEELEDTFVSEISDRNSSSEDVIIETKRLLSRVTVINHHDNGNILNQSILCYVSQVCTSFVCTLSILSILLIGVNQYFGVMHSLRYHFYVNKCRSTIFIATSWLVALVFSALSSVTNSDSCLWQLCPSDGTASNSVMAIVNTTYAVSYFVLIILAPFVAICVIYVCIYTAAHKNSERMRKSTSANLDIYRRDMDGDGDDAEEDFCKTVSSAVLPKVQSAPSFTNFEVTANNNVTKVTRTSSDRSGNFITSLKHKISNASVFRYREETRAAKISILVIFFVLICYVPYGVTLVLNSGLVGTRTSRTFNYLSLILLIFSNLISPFLFAYRNKRVKREIGKIFGLVPPRDADTRSNRRASLLNRRKSMTDGDHFNVQEPFLECQKVPQVVVTCKNETERKSILKRVCSTGNWAGYKKCNFITVPDNCCIGTGEARGSFSSASTQISNEDC